ncbi:MAG: hypothetical protein H0T51_15345 [Pirellulales bacterium]|nr:hypothetical protein [Pirellulales bacterium]
MLTASSSEVLSEGDGGLSLAEWQSEIASLRDLLDEADWLVAQRVPKRDLAERTDDVADLIDRVLNGVPVYLSTVVINGVVALRTITYNLLDVMKLQLVEAIVEKKSYRTCEQCAKPFEVSPQVNRSDRVYCSDNCRVKAYQRRRKQAIAMRAKGDTLREIAKKLGSDVPTVKKWVGEAQKEE